MLELFGFGVDDLDAIAAVAHVSGDQPAPQRRLDGGEIVAQRLIYLLAPVRIDEQQVKCRNSSPLVPFRNLYSTK